MIQTKQKIAVDPDRLRNGTWSEQFNKTVGEGDIAASYSADRIGMGEKIRQPFIHEGEVWVCVGRRGRGSALPGAEAYRLVPIDWYAGQPVDQFLGSYAEKTANTEWARQDPNGFYHGVIVQRGGQHLVMHGPPTLFVPGQVAQPGLFGPG